MLEVFQSDNFQNSDMELPIALEKLSLMKHYLIDLAKNAAFINGRSNWSR